MDATFDALIQFGRSVADAGLLASTCGNASLVADDRMVVTASGAYLGELARKHLAVVEVLTGEHLSGPVPSMELDIHRRVCLARPGVGAILHCQSRAATLLACSVDPPTELDFIPEIPAYVRAHRYVPYQTPGSEELAQAVCAALEDPEVTVVQMVNHGQVVIGADWPTVVRRATFFELACWMATQGRKLSVIPPDQVDALRQYARDV